MENLIFKHKGWALSRRIIGAIWILFGTAELLFPSHVPLTISHSVISICYVLLGMIFFTPLVGNNETSFVSSNGSLKIKWATRIGTIIIRNDEIEKIILRNTKIEIRRKEKKPVVLIFERFKLENKTKVYEFMIEYARQKNLIVEK